MFFLEETYLSNEDFISDREKFFDKTRIVKFYNIDDQIYRYFSNIIERYYSKNIDPSHDKRHIYQVTNAMLYLSEKLNLDSDISIAIGSLHDIGLIYGDRKFHHENSAKWVLSHRKDLSRFYNDYEINLIAQSVREHRSSIKIKSSIYSEAITDADKIPSHNVDNVLLRAWDYTCYHNPNYTEKELFESMYKHVHIKYGKINEYGNKFYTEPAILFMKPFNREIVKYTNNKEKCYQKLMSLL